MTAQDVVVGDGARSRAVDQPLFDRVGPTYDDRGPSWTVSTNARGIVVLRPRYFAHPDRRDPAYMAEQVRLKGLDRALVAEGEKWDAPAGTPYCPRFAEATREVQPWRFEGRYIADAPAVWANLPLICGYDGGLHRPALIMGQYDPESGTLWIQREFRPLTPHGQPIDTQAHEFLGVVRYLTGRATLDQLRAEDAAGKWSMRVSLAWIEQERREPFYGWPMPWIEPGSGAMFYDVMAGHEGLKRNELAPYADVNTLVGMYRQHGIGLRVFPETWAHREQVLEFLLRDGAIEGVPRLLVDSSCRTLCKGMAGGLQAAAPGRRKPYIEDCWLEDAVDAFLNVAVAAFPTNQPDLLVQRETRDRRAREAAQPLPQQTGRRYVPPAIGDGGASYGGVW